MLKILQSLRNNKIIQDFEIIDFKEGSNPNNFFYIKIHAKLIDGSDLFIREFRSSQERNYSYQWQLKDNLKIRWDNAPHHKNLDTFPHHKHLPEIVSSKEVEIDEILIEIENKIKIK